MTSATPAHPSAQITIQADQPRAISPDLFGIFFEDINYAADGGLYAELIQNRSFAYSSDDNPDWNFFTAWELIHQRGACSVGLGTDQPLHPNNPHYLMLQLEDEVGLKNYGFDRIPLKKDDYYDVALFTRVLDGAFGELTVRLESRTGAILGEAHLPAPTAAWTKVSATIQASADDRHAHFVVYVQGAGALALDVISLFPQATFHNRPNGLRADLAQAIADLKPRFMRFPGGCLAHGDGLGNIYHWQDTIGAIETRREQRNIWNYHQTVGLGYFEYFQFCEDIGAKPIPVVAAGVCCQGSGGRFSGQFGHGQEGLPLDQMPAYIQEVLDLIEWANGSPTSTWGAKRAEAGHPEPFGLEYLAIGNEDKISPLFIERFRLIYEAVQARHPEITLIGNVGPGPGGADYEAGWQLAREMNLPIVDEHGYELPDWYWDNLYRYDGYDRAASAVYLGEYAAHDVGRSNTLRSALAEAAYMTALERNGDLVVFSSYAPLLGKNNRMQWKPDLIYFDTSTVYWTLTYFAQQLFSVNAGDTYLRTDIHFEQPKTLAASCVRDSASGDIIVKLVSRADVPVRVQIDLGNVDNIAPTAACTVLSGDPLGENNYAEWRRYILTPVETTLEVAPQFEYGAPAHSLTVIRITPAG